MPRWCLGPTCRFCIASSAGDWHSNYLIVLHILMPDSATLSVRLRFVLQAGTSTSDQGRHQSGCSWTAVKAPPNIPAAYQGE
ncbi:hypothetical protein BDW62DRAFT_175094 [Aspergillus aurantiobrunneus]